MGRADQEIHLDRSKLLNVVHYVCAACDGDKLGKVKLHKILYFSDMLSYTMTGAPLTGVEYQKQPFGPCARHLGWAIAELGKAGKIAVTEREFYGLKKFEFKSLTNVDRQSFSNREIALLDDVIDFVCDRSAKEISELSHQVPWQLAKLGEEIPYFTAFSLQPVEITDEDVEWARSEVRFLGQET
jgi:uncharacterized phage-associated protein